MAGEEEKQEQGDVNAEEGAPAQQNGGGSKNKKVRACLWKARSRLQRGMPGTAYV